jgi:hypothetical protein
LNLAVTSFRYRSTHPTFVAWNLCITMSAGALEQKNQ